MAVNRFLLSLAASSAQSVGHAVRLQDTNNTGADDVIGTIAELVGGGLLEYADGDVKGLNGYLKLANDALTTYLASIPPTEIATKKELHIK